MKILLALVLAAASTSAQDQAAAPNAPSADAPSPDASSANAPSAQDLADRMLASSVVIYGMVKENGGHLTQVSQGAGFFLTPQIVITSSAVCCTRIKGQMAQPRVVLGTQSAFAKVTWNSPEEGLALLQLDQPLGGADADLGVSVMPSKYTRAGQPVFAVQFPGPGESDPAQVATGELQDLAPSEGLQTNVFQTSAPMNAFNACGALFDACGNAVGVNWKSAGGSQYAFPLDALLEQVDNAGLSEKVLDGPCVSSLEAAASPWWRLPLGSQWIAIVIMVLMLASVGLWLGKKNAAAKQ